MSALRRKPALYRPGSADLMSPEKIWDTIGKNRAEK
jgi:hypothetical protein